MNILNICGVGAYLIELVKYPGDTYWQGFVSLVSYVDNAVLKKDKCFLEVCRVGHVEHEEGGEC